MIQEAIANPANLQLPAWILSVSLSSAAAVRSLLWLRGDRRGGNNNLGATIEGEFRGTIKTLIRNQVELTEAMHAEIKQQGQLIEAHGHLITESCEAMGSMSRTLTEHDVREREIWDEVLHCLKRTHDRLDKEKS